MQACPSGSPPMALAGGQLYNLSDQGTLDAAMLEAFAPLQVNVLGVTFMVRSCLIQSMHMHLLRNLMYNNIRIF